MSKPKFVYVVYIASTAEQIWKALTDGEITKTYWWHHANVSDWRVGSEWKHQDHGDPSVVDIVGKVVECTPPRRLVYTWARPADEQDDSRHSRVSFDIEAQADGLVRLTVAHSDLERDPQMLEGVSGGWPRVLSNLKTLLETGHALPRTASAS